MRSIAFMKQDSVDSAKSLHPRRTMTIDLTGQSTIESRSTHMILLFHTGVVNRETPDQPEDVSFDRICVRRASRFDCTALAPHNSNHRSASWKSRLRRGRCKIAAMEILISISTFHRIMSLIKKRDDYGFFRSIFWWSGVISPHTSPTALDAFEKLVFGSDVFGGELGEFDESQARYHAMLDACRVPPAVQAKIFSGTMRHILQQQSKEAAEDKGN